MSLSNDLPCRCSRLVLTLLLAWVWVGGVHSVHAQPAPTTTGSGGGEPLDPARAAERVKRCFRAMDAVDRDLPRDTFDLAAVAAGIGKDPQATLAWVRDHTVWVPYQGSLRGPLGVLMDRRGNGLDRAMLLAEMLRAQGYATPIGPRRPAGGRGRALAQNRSFVPKQPLMLAPAADHADRRNDRQQVWRTVRLGCRRPAAEGRGACHAIPAHDRGHRGP